jgi:haloalkane dehalogenase
MSNLQPFGSPHQVIDLGHSRVPYYRVGRGPDLFFVHGWPLYSATFRNIVPALADRYTCHLIDLPGTGHSDWGRASQIGLREHAASVRRVIDGLGLERYAFVAHDSGAMIAQLVAVDDARVVGSVFGNTEIAGHHAWQIGLYVRVDRAPLGTLLFGSLLALKAFRHSQLAYGGCFHDPEFCEGEFRELFVDPMRTKRGLAGQRRLLDSFTPKALEGLSALPTKQRAPVKFVWGAQDPFFPLERLRPTLTAFGGGASVALIDPGKLFAHEEFPEQFASHARSFLESCWSSSARGSLAAE